MLGWLATQLDCVKTAEWIEMKLDREVGLEHGQCIRLDPQVRKKEQSSFPKLGRLVTSVNCGNSAKWTEMKLAPDLVEYLCSF